MKFEEEYRDVLQNIEFVLVQSYRQHEEMTDWEAEQAVNGLMRTYKAEQRKRKAPHLRLNPLAQEVYDDVRAMCEWRLGRIDLQKSEGEKQASIDLPVEPLSLEEIVACLKRIRKSIQMWHKQGGRRGYYDFVSEFLL
jgi:hypothetical protein